MTQLCSPSSPGLSELCHGALLPVCTLSRFDWYNVSFVPFFFGFATHLQTSLTSHALPTSKVSMTIASRLLQALADVTSFPTFLA